MAPGMVAKESACILARAESGFSRSRAKASSRDARACKQATARDVR